jgi:uncharacterized protein YodC (DUF2158 family)
METKKFKNGDVVILRSGGPRMTIIGDSKKGVQCCWFDNRQTEHRSTFPSGALSPEHVDDLTDEELKRRLSAEQNN